MIELVSERWIAATERERSAMAESLLRELPTGFRLVGVREHELGSRRFPIAAFAWRERTFSLVPGGTFKIGWNADAWQPDDAELASYDASAEEYGIDATIVEHARHATLRPRRIDIVPLLVEQTADEIGWTSLDPDDREVHELMSRMPPGGRPYTVTTSDGDAEVRVRRLADGSIHAERSSKEATHAVVARELANEGFRFPTSDEWEYLCGAGATTLFRWGDHAPCDRYPSDVSPEEAAWRREWVLSAGTLERPSKPFRSDWEFHRQPNAFGLHIALDPYKCELVAEPDCTRGGDGGSMICGGTGFFLGWLTLATAYFEDHACRRDPDEPINAGYTIGRRVLPLG